MATNHPDGFLMCSFNPVNNNSLQEVTKNVFDNITKLFLYLGIIITKYNENK